MEKRSGGCVRFTTSALGEDFRLAAGSFFGVDLAVKIAAEPRQLRRICTSIQLSTRRRSNCSLASEPINTIFMSTYCGRLMSVMLLQWKVWSLTADGSLTGI